MLCVCVYACVSLYRGALAKTRGDAYKLGGYPIARTPTAETYNYRGSSSRRRLRGASSIEGEEKRTASHSPFVTYLPRNLPRNALCALEI